MKLTYGIILPLYILSMPVMANSFIDDSQGSLMSRNYYFDREYTDPQKIGRAKDWTQGFILNLKSGYTEGKVGLGLDLQALTAIKIIGDSDYIASGLIPTDKITRERADTASELGITGKIKYEDSELKIGTVMPFNPIISSSRSRLLPQTFRGTLFESKDIDNIELYAGYIDKVNHRDSTNYETMSITTSNGRFNAAQADNLSFLGSKYSPSKDTQYSLYYGIIDDLYAQAAFIFNNTYMLTENTRLLSDLRFWNSNEHGRALAGKIDNTLLTGNFGFNYNNHLLTLSTMQNFGDTAHPYLSGGEVQLFVEGWGVDFLNPKEKVYSIRYDYNFQDYVPGLRAAIRYIKGTNIDLPQLGGNNLKEDSKAFELQYNFQQSYLKGLSFRTRYMTSDNNFAKNTTFKPANETRINIDYTWKF
ncbi:OprD family outer membrane porin [Acinetobacter sichuanensis]|uniref:OprD family outer membrane porin n=1 Tax=Acinetobacter sichuanensis TaxID=2136183 RepID=UPI00280F259B|nr:OprD family outer membrane porin [Acinetobacter sichuanensis]MDQ9022082.1 OprD family outer membrane porin [Acinetobacter sichuanensis]